MKDLPCLRDNYCEDDRKYLCGIITVFADLFLSSKPGFTYNKQNNTEARFECKCYKDCETYAYNVQVATSILSRKYSTNHLDL